MKHRKLIVGGLAVLLTGTMIFAADRKIPLNMTTDGYTLDNLPVVADNVRVLQVSSRNKTGENIDVGQYLYIDSNGDPVMFDAIGPGCIKSIWSTNVVEHDKLLKFYFDDETTPRITIDAYEMYSGKNLLFPAPLSSYAKTGQFEAGVPYAGNCFVPIPFKHRLRIAVDKNSKTDNFFYHVIYEKFTPGSCAETIDFVDLAGQINPKVLAATGLADAFARQGQDVKKDQGTRTLTSTVKGVFLTGDPKVGVTAIEYEGQGSIRRLTLDMPADPEYFKKLYIYIQFDSARFFQVLAPLDLLFANAHKPTAVRSLPIVVEEPHHGRVKAHLYFPMPFWKSFKIGFGNDQIYGPMPSADIPGGLNLEVSISDQTYSREDAGYFTTSCHQGQTTYGEDWVLGRQFGKGVFCGVVQSMQYQQYCEGDERFYLDGSMSPAFHGTGSEDYYLCCYWPNYNINLPFAGCVGNIKQEAGLDGQFGTIPACYYRFHLEAPIPFHSQIDARIEHGGDSDIHSLYRTLSFFYVNPHSNLIQTDMINVGNIASETAHQYVSTSREITRLKMQYEGADDRVDIMDTGRYHKNTDVRFTAAIQPDNRGVRLRRRLDQRQGRNMVDVYVDGERVGRWYQADQNDFKRWCDLDFEIPVDYTRGKESITVILKSVPDQPVGDFSDFRYWIISKM